MWGAATEAKLREGHFFRERALGKRTLGELVDRYLESVVPGKRNERNQRVQLNWWRAQLGHLPIAAITRATIVDCRDRLEATPVRGGQRRAPATVVRYLAALSHVYSVAMRDWEWADDNPVRLVRKPKEPRGRVRFLDDGERERLLAACRASGSTAPYTAVVLALSTGMRRGEIMSLRWRQVDLTRRVITLETTKNGERRGVPLRGLAAELLAARCRLRRIDTDLVSCGVWRQSRFSGSTGQARAPAMRLRSR